MWRIALCLALVASGCSSGGGSETGASVAETTMTRAATTTVAETTTVPASTIEEEIEAAYLAQIEAYAEMFALPRPDNPLIDLTYTGAYKQLVLDLMAPLLLDGNVVRRPEDPGLYRAAVTDVTVRSETEAIVNACVIDGLQVVHAATGVVVNDAVATLEVTATYTFVDGAWKQFDSTADRTEGVVTCDP